MALTLTMGKGYFKVRHTNGSRTTTWEVSAETTQDEVLQVFRDVIAFVEGEQAAEPLPRISVVHRAPALIADPKGLEPAPAGNGWAAFAPPPIPDHLKGEVELVEPPEST